MPGSCNTASWQAFTCQGPCVSEKTKLCYSQRGQFGLLEATGPWLQLPSASWKHIEFTVRSGRSVTECNGCCCLPLDLSMCHHGVEFSACFSSLFSHNLGIAAGIPHILGFLTLCSHLLRTHWNNCAVLSMGTVAFLMSFLKNLGLSFSHLRSALGVRNSLCWMRN